MGETVHQFISDLVHENVGPEGQKYFPYILSLFLFILAGNFLGMIPYGFTFTSHIGVTFGLAVIVFSGVTIIGFCRHGLHFLDYFAPKEHLFT